MFETKLQGKQGLLLLVDFEKAFDTEPKEIWIWIQHGEMDQHINQ